MILEDNYQGKGKSNKKMLTESQGKLEKSLENVGALQVSGRQPVIVSTDGLAALHVTQIC